MATTSENFYWAASLPGTADTAEPSLGQQIYEANWRRLYALSFWMMDNELAAETLMVRTFLRAFSFTQNPSSEVLDRALIGELRALLPLGPLSLNCAVSTATAGVRRNVLRTHLERAVVQLPPTERLIFLMHDVENYGHDRIGHYLNLTESQSKNALHQARLRLRELLAEMIS
jgi:DNA-directed RNA polymerase specialized sigma subunit